MLIVNPILGAKRVEYTTALNPDHNTDDWIQVGDSFVSHPGRNIFKFSTGLRVSGLRIRTSDGNDCIDELEVFAEGCVSIASTESVITKDVDDGASEIDASIMIFGYKVEYRSTHQVDEISFTKNGVRTIPVMRSMTQGVVCIFN